MAVKAKDFLSFNDGTAAIFGIENAAEAGDKPKEKLTHKCTVRYREQTVGMARYYEALQAQVEISAVVLIPDVSRFKVSTQDIAILGGVQYRIVQVQKKTDTLPPSLALSLSKVTEVYDVQSSESST